MELCRNIRCGGVASPPKMACIGLRRACKDPEDTALEVLLFGLVSRNRPVLDRPQRPIAVTGARWHADKLGPDRDRRCHLGVHKEVIVARDQLVRFDPDLGSEPKD